MKQTAIRYDTKLDRADENEQLIKRVFEELHVKAPQGVRYVALRLGHDSFMHLVSVETEDGSNPIPQLEAFRTFQSGIPDRCMAPPQSTNAITIGNYRMLTG